MEILRRRRPQKKVDSVSCTPFCFERGFLRNKILWVMAKKYTGNEILESEKSSEKNIFECSTWVAHKRLYVFGQKRVQFNGRKGCSSKRLEKKGTPLGLGPRKDTAVNVCRAELKMWRISFFGPKP